jgi:hypothetical protein
MKLKLSLLALAAAMVTVLVVAPVAPAAKPAAPTNVTAPVTGTVAGGGTFAGTLSNIHFVNQNGTLAAVGNLTGTLTNAAGGLIGNVTNVPITLPIGGAAPAGGSCQILDLKLGPLDLNLLGLMVHLDQVHLNITAQQGPGNLLGNLLCGVANALNGGGGGGLANLLNRLLGGLGL